MTRPTTPFEAASYDLVKFRERRMAERRATPRGTLDRRIASIGEGADKQQEQREAAGEKSRES